MDQSKDNLPAAPGEKPGIVKATKDFFGNALSTIFAVMVGVAVYGVVILAIKGITTDEIRMLPKGNKIAKIVEKIQR